MKTLGALCVVLTCVGTVYAQTTTTTTTTTPTTTMTPPPAAEKKAEPAAKKPTTPEEKKAACLDKAKVAYEKAQAKCEPPAPKAAPKK